MKKALVAIVLPLMVLSLCHRVGGQAGPDSLDAKLIVAAMTGDATAVQWLLQKGANLEGKDHFGDTALLWAAFAGKTDVVRLLLGNVHRPLSTD